MIDAGYATAFGVILAASVGSLVRSEWTNRRPAGALLIAQSDKSEADTAKIIDELARSWIEELRTEVANSKALIETLTARLNQEIEARRNDSVIWANTRAVYLDHFLTLENHINDGKAPPPPARPAGAI